MYYYIKLYEGLGYDNPNSYDGISSVCRCPISDELTFILPQPSPMSNPD